MRVEGPEGNASRVERADAVFGPLIAERRAALGDDLVNAVVQ